MTENACDKERPTKMHAEFFMCLPDMKLAKMGIVNPIPQPRKRRHVLVPEVKPNIWKGLRTMQMYLSIAMISVTMFETFTDDIIRQLMT